MLKNYHLVSAGWIWTHDLSNISLLTYRYTTYLSVVTIKYYGIIRYLRYESYVPHSNELD